MEGVGPETYLISLVLEFRKPTERLLFHWYLIFRDGEVAVGYALLFIHWIVWVESVGCLVLFRHDILH